MLLKGEKNYKPSDCRHFGYDVNFHRLYYGKKAGTTVSVGITPIVAIF